MRRRAVHQVVAGDTLWAIVESHYGYADGELVWRVAEANGLQDPSSIPIGTLITLPALGGDATSPPETAATGRST